MESEKIIKIVIIGASGFGKEVLWTIEDCNKTKKQYNVIGFIDDNKKLLGKKIHGKKVLGGLEWFSKNNLKNLQCVIAISDCDIREKLVKRISKHEIKFGTIIHPSSIISKFVKIGKGTIIQAGNIITTDVVIKDHVHVNIACTIGHDSIIDNFVTLNPGVRVNGNTTIEKNCNIGTGSILKQGITVEKKSITGAGTVLIDDVPEHSMFVGVPGKIKKKLQ